MKARNDVGEEVSVNMQKQDGEVVTARGKAHVAAGNYILTDKDGNVTVCHPKTFDASYTVVKEK